MTEIEILQIMAIYLPEFPLPQSRKKGFIDGINACIKFANIKPCPHCKTGKLEVTPGTLSSDDPYLICDNCCSTYNL